MTGIAAFTTDFGVSAIEAKSDETRNSFKMDRIIARSFGKIALTKHYTSTPVLTVTLYVPNFSRRHVCRRKVRQ
jgi:hypothetical protein